MEKDLRALYAEEFYVRDASLNINNPIKSLSILDE